GPACTEIGSRDRFAVTLLHGTAFSLHIPVHVTTGTLRVTRTKLCGPAIDSDRPDVRASKPVVLFESGGFGLNVSANYDVLRDGSFITLRLLGGASRLILTINWIGELTKAFASGSGED
ncbi:MAG TPA: hypothetical protein VGU74_03325, partial [Gemmatimonadales bacterium]|nr:hypothetical protein [Gemmatimonadales bacterium]